MLQDQFETVAADSPPQSKAALAEVAMPVLWFSVEHVHDLQRCLLLLLAYAELRVEVRVETAQLRESNMCLQVHDLNL